MYKAEFPFTSRSLMAYVNYIFIHVCIRKTDDLITKEAKEHNVLDGSKQADFYHSRLFPANH
jgi:hypothetical protein